MKNVFATGISCIATAMLISSNSIADIIYDSHGFEPGNFNLGSLNGQNGFVGFVDGNGLGLEPEVVGSSNPRIGEQSVRMEVPDVATAQSYIELPIADLLAAGYVRVTVSYDIYREFDFWNSNLWWYWFNTGSPTFGLQWDTASGISVTYPFEFNGDISEETVLDTWANLTMTWDLCTGEASAEYDGFRLGSMPIADISTLTGWGLLLAHDDAGGNGPETAWIDNFIITGVKAADINSFDMVTGTHLGGDVTELNTSDDAYLHTRSGFGETLIDLHNMEIYIMATSAVDSPSTMTVCVESHIDEESGTEKISLRNWNTGNFETILQHQIGSTDGHSIIEDLDPIDYVGNSGEVEIAIKHIVFVPFLAFTFESFIDTVKVVVE